MSRPDHLGTTQPRLVLYLPHRPNSLEQLASAPNARDLVALNSNHWRKIVTILAKVSSPGADKWRAFRDENLFQEVALGFTPELRASSCWHWIAGKENLQRFDGLEHNAQVLQNCEKVAIDGEKRLLLTPYPDYRQLSNLVITHIRAELERQGFYR